jgi:ribosome-interacting GTPase 1
LVTNLPPKVKARWARASSTTDPREKLTLLREVLANIPKHKGTERLVMSLKRQIKNLEEEIEERRLSRRGKTVSVWSLRKEGDLLVAVLGRAADCVRFHEWASGQKVDVPQLFNRPVYGALKASGIVVQYALLTVEFEFSEKKLKNVGSAAANTDVVITLVDSLGDPLIDFIEKLMELRNVVLSPRPVDLSISYVTAGGIRLLGSSKNFTREQLFDMLRAHGIFHAVVTVSEETTLYDIENTIMERIFKPMILVSIRSPVQPPIISINVYSPEALVKRIVESLNKMTVYIKEPDQNVTHRALLVNHGINVKEFAEIVYHKLVPSSLWAKIQREQDGRFLRVGPDFSLQDGDVVEFHI